jgi:hypothetical protein
MKNLPSMSDPRPLGRHWRRRFRMRTVLLALVVLLGGRTTAGQPTSTPPPPDPMLTFMTGRWEGAGTILGQSARVELDWTAVLGDRFARLTWVSHIGAAPKSQRFEGLAYYQRTPNPPYRGTWFDSGGMVRPITAAIDRPALGVYPSALVAAWGTPDTEQGETTYRRLSPDQLEVVDRVLGKNGAWREFGRSTLRRVP